MSSSTLEKREKRATIVKEARDKFERARADGREWSADDQAAFDRALADADKLKADYEREERLEAAERELKDAQPRKTRSPDPGAHGGDGAALVPYSFDLLRQGGRAKSRVTFQPGEAAWKRHQSDYRAALQGWIRNGSLQAALQTDVDTQGGYLTVPEQMVGELLKDLDDTCWIRSLARTFTTNAQTLGVIKRTARFRAWNWGGELSSAENNADTTLRFGKRSLTPHYMTGSVLLSRDLLRSAVMDPEAILMDEIKRDSEEFEEDAFLTGTGDQQPLGLFTASADGISTGRDVSAGNSATKIGADNLRECKYTLKEQYRRDPSLRWLFHRTAVKQISLLKDGEGQYLWKPGITEGDTDTILNVKLVESERSPSTFTTGQYVGMLGAFRYYWIVDALGMELQRLVETYAKYNQIQFIARRKLDAMPQIEEAFVRVKLG